MSRIRCVVVVCVILVALGGVGMIAGATGTDSSHDTGTHLDSPDESLFQTDIDADSIEMEAAVRPDGDADWRVTYRLELDDDESVQAFEDLQADIDDDPGAYLDPFEDRMQRIAESGEATTQREMTVRGFDIETERTVQPDTEFGEVVFRFEWAGFAAVDDETVYVGDAVDSLFLDEETSLTFRWDDSLTLDSHTPQADTVGDQRLVWRGPLDFERGEPRAELSRESSSAVSTDLLSAPVLLVLLVIALGTVALAVYLRQRDETATTDTNGAESESGPMTTDEPPSELLSNEERVLTLVEENGGRIKQKKVAETLDWSAAMTSQVVGNLREEEQIETFRIGRENVLTLPDVDIVPDQDDPNRDEQDTDREDRQS